ncbi:MAG: DUF2780 domain-containing protein, partial [Pseudomonas sp.]|nr:DUF2780 domain-containing protein [Pseudomonas sp.]
MKTAHRLLLLGALSMTTFPALAFSLSDAANVVSAAGGANAGGEAANLLG